MGCAKINVMMASIVLTVAMSSQAIAFDQARSINYAREVAGPSSSSSYNHYSQSNNKPYKFKLTPEQLAQIESNKARQKSEMAKNAQPKIPEIVELSGLKRSVNPEFRPASLNNKPEAAKVPKIVKPKWSPIVSKVSANNPKVKAKALYCVDRSSNKVILAENVALPLPIASITKLLTAMIVVDEMDLNSRVVVPHDIREVEKHTVGVRSGDIFSVNDLLHGMLIESGNDCAEALARAYPHGGRAAFLDAMNRKAKLLGASSVKIFTPSGLDHKFILGRKGARELPARKPNVATAQDVALIADHAFKYPLIAKISSTKKYTMRTLNEKSKDYPIFSNDRLLDKNLPVAGAKTGFTNMAGKCIVALFKDDDKEHLVVVLNTSHHFKAAEKIYRWASNKM